jgi:hypothetical protein
MNAAREAIYLPVLFLTVALLGGVRIGQRVTLLPPTPFALMLALLLTGILVRCGALAPDRLMSASRRTLANLNGFVLLVAMFFASAQAFNTATPDAGLPRVVFSVFLLVLLLNTLAALPDRVHVLRSLMVVFGSAFVIKYIVLATLSSPVDGRLKQALLLLLEGVTLGTLTQEPFHAVTGYLALVTLFLFLVGLALLPNAAYRDLRPGSALERRPRADVQGSHQV